MTMDRALNYLAALIAVAIIAIGARFLLAPDAAAAGFGLPVGTAGRAIGFLDAKGVRDIVSGLVTLSLLFSGQKLGLGIFLLVAALIPLGDMSIVLAHDGPAATAFGVHGATAALLVLVGGGLIWRNRSLIRA
jgi:hypothetical protein